MTRLSAFYGEVYEENYSTLSCKKDPHDKEFKDILENFASSSIIIKGKRGSKATITAHPTDIEQFLFRK